MVIHLLQYSRQVPRIGSPDTSFGFHSPIHYGRLGDSDRTPPLSEERLQNTRPGRVDGNIGTLRLYWGSFIYNNI